MIQSRGGTKSASKMATNSPLCGVEAGVEGSGFIAVAVCAVDVVDRLWGKAVEAGGVALDDGAGNLGGLVGGVVEDLDFKAVAGVVEAAAGFEQAMDDELLVEDGELDGDEGELACGEVGCRLGGFRAAFLRLR